MVLWISLSMVVCQCTEPFLKAHLVLADGVHVSVWLVLSTGSAATRLVQLLPRFELKLGPGTGAARWRWYQHAEHTSNARHTCESTCAAGGAETLFLTYVCGLQEVERLSVLPHLVVLDLVGNPVVSATDGYRLLLLFKLRALKVLDGVAADAAELAAAQAAYAGRLTLSLLVSIRGSTGGEWVQQHWLLGLCEQFEGQHSHFSKRELEHGLIMSCAGNDGYTPGTPSTQVLPCETPLPSHVAHILCASLCCRRRSCSQAASCPP